MEEYLLNLLNMLNLAKVVNNDRPQKAMK